MTNTKKNIKPIALSTLFQTAEWPSRNSSKVTSLSSMPAPYAENVMGVLTRSALPLYAQHLMNDALRRGDYSVLVPSQSDAEQWMSGTPLFRALAEVADPHEHEADIRDVIVHFGSAQVDCSTCGTVLSGMDAIAAVREGDDSFANFCDDEVLRLVNLLDRLKNKGVESDDLDKVVEFATR